MMLKFEEIQGQSVLTLYDEYSEIWCAIYFDENLLSVDQLRLKHDATEAVPGLAGFIIRTLSAKSEGAMFQGKFKVLPKRKLDLELKGVSEKTSKANTEKYQSLCYEGCDHVDPESADANFKPIQHKRFG